MNLTILRLTLYALLFLANALLAGGTWTLFLLGRFRQMDLPFPPLPWAIVLTLCLPLWYYLLYRMQHRSARQVLFLLDAVENDDYSVHFPEDDRDQDIRLVNRALNRIAHIIQNVKNDTAQREKYYGVILECIHTGVVVLNDKGAVYQKNTEALRLLGLNVFTHVSQLERISKEAAARLASCRTGDAVQMQLHSERGTLTLLLRVSDINLHGEHLRIVTLSDINSALDEKEMDSWMRLTRVLTHEIMNGVTPITSLSDTLTQLITQDAPREEILNGLHTISQTGKGLLAFVDSYRRFTHLPTPVPSLFYVKGFLERMAELARHLHPDVPVQVDIQVEPADLIVYADENLIAQVVTNLLKNAVQALRERVDQTAEGHICLRSFADDNEAVIIDVSNNGPAIPPDVASHIFIPFFTTKQGGSGIGLSISRQIMQLSGGSLTLMTGTPVTFRLKFD